MESSNGEVLTMDSLTIEEKNDIYVKIAGISKLGRVFGRGSLQSGISMSLDGSAVPPQATEEVGTLMLRDQELEMELQKSREDNVVIQKRLDSMEKLIQSFAGPSGSNAAAPQTSMGVGSFAHAT